MALLVSDVFSRFRRLVQDQEAVRWTDAELFDWLNDACRQIVALKPDANALTAAFACVAGTKQSLPVDGIVLLDVVRNVLGTKRAVRLTSRNVLDSEVPTWHNEAGVTGIKNYTYDPRQQNVFYVYPPALLAATTADGTGAVVEIVYSAAPTTVTFTTDPLPLNDIYISPVVNYVVFRAFAKDADYAQNSNMSEAYYGKFMAEVGGKQSAEVTDAPATNAPSIKRGAA